MSKYLSGTIISKNNEGGGGYHLPRSKDPKNLCTNSFFSSSLRRVSKIFSIFQRFLVILVSFYRNCHGLRYLINLQRPNSGVIMMLAILFVPIVLFGIKYSQTLLDRREKILEKTDGPFYRKYYPTKVAVIMAKAWESAKTLGNQQLDSAYEEAFNSGVWCQNSALGGAIDGIMLSNSGTTDDASAPATSGPPDAPTTSAGKIAQAKKDIAIAIEDDKIKVTCNKKSAYALAAECNLDLVLAIPTNSDAKVTEIGQASANFVKDNFCHTRGVYASVIPYSGKLSLPSNRYDGWTEAFQAFSPADTSENRYNLRLTLHELYGTQGIKGISLSTIYNGVGTNNGYSITCRANLFDSTNASSAKYKRMNLNPCTAITTGLYDDFICPLDCTTYTPNPHTIMEPTADLSTAYAKCNSLTLPSDTKNTSSFSFAALEWANNMLQDWTNNPQTSAVSGVSNGILTNPSKTTAGRKKAIVLIVNKPDTFTAGELTYLGLSNDADEIYISDEFKWTEITMPSEQLWRSVCYGDGKFVAVYSAVYPDFIRGTAYSSDGINWVQSTVGSIGSDLCYGGGKFVAVPIRSDVAAYSNDGINWTQSTLPSLQVWFSVCYGGGKFVAVTNATNYIGDYSNVAAYSSDGIHWAQSNLSSLPYWSSVCYGGGKFVAVSWDDNVALYGSDGIHWSTSTMPSKQIWYSVCYGGGKFVTVAYNSNIAAYSSDGINWTQSTLPSLKYWQSVCYGGGKFVAVAHRGVGDKAAACGEFIVKTNTVGNKALKDALGNGIASGVTTLTTNVCNKLKEAYGDDVRIYLVKYRKSAGDYGYLDNCATSTGGKSYDVGNSAALKTTLDTIATDLKSWAGYTEARVVD